MHFCRALTLLGWSLAVPTLFATPGTADSSTDSSLAAHPGGAGRWVSLAPIPTYRQEHRSVAIKGQIYVFGGVLPGLPNGTYPTTDLNQKYNVANDSWTTVAPMPIALNHINAAAVNGKIYVLGGMAFQNNNWVAVRDCFSYDPTSDTWTSIGKIPEGRQVGSAAVGTKDNTIYLAGGITVTNLTNYADNTTAIFTSYDVSSQTWTNLPDVSVARRSVVARLIVKVARPS
jgi:N-acetylneuraminic acid mutarotase